MPNTNSRGLAYLFLYSIVWLFAASELAAEQIGRAVLYSGYLE